MDRSRNSLCLAGEPPREAESIVQLTLGLEKGLSCFVGDNIGNVVSVLPDQSIPLQKPLCSGSGVNFAIALESFMGPIDCGIDIFGSVVWC